MLKICREFVILKSDLKKKISWFNFNLILLMFPKSIFSFILILSLLSNISNCWGWSSIFGSESEEEDNK